MRRPKATARRALIGCALPLLVGLGGCSLFGGGGTSSPSPTATDSVSPGSGTASPDDSPSGSPSSGDSASPGDSATPGSTPSGSSTPGSTPGSSTSAAPVSCTSVTPVRIQKVSTDPRRTIEIVTLVSDGRNLTPGTREQSEFGTPTLTAPDSSAITDESTTKKIADLIGGSSKNKVLLTRPDPPDTGADANRRPYNSPGTYVAYNATSPLTADVIVQCSGQEQRWQFTAESDLTTGQVNCAVEPPKSNAVARLVYTNNC